MALPDALERREILYGKGRRAAEYAELGKRYQQDGRRNDALECFEKLEDKEQRAALLKDMRDDAIKQGLHFVLNRLHASLPVEQGQWLQAAKNAREQGKLLYALSSARRAEDAKLVAELEQELGIERVEEEVAPGLGAFDGVDGTEVAPGVMPTESGRLAVQPGVAEAQDEAPAADEAQADDSEEPAKED